MKNTSIIFLFLFILSFSTCFAQVKDTGSLVLDGIPDIPSKFIEGMLQYQNIRTAAFMDWNSYGPGILISTRFGETAQIHYVQWPTGARQQLTFFKEPVASAASCPNPETRGFLFSMDVGGGEFYQLFFFDYATAKSTMLTDGKSRNTAAMWSADGKQIVFSSNLRNGADMDIRIMDLNKPGISEIVFEVNGLWQVCDWSEDKTKLLLINYISINESYLHILDMATKVLAPVNPQPDKKISYSAALFDKNAKGVFYSSDEFGEFQEVIYYELATGNKTRLTSHIPWDVSELALSHNGKKLAYTANEDGISKLHILDLSQNNKELRIPQPPVSVISNIKFNSEDTELAMTVNAAHIPGDVYSINLLTEEITRWTLSEVGGLKAENFVAPELIHYPTFDEVDGKARMIPAFYYRPKNITGKTPVVISIHGGPEGQELPTFSSSYQYMASEMGIAIIAPNVRGSSGYGKTYLTLDNWYLRMNSVKDIGSLLDWIAKQPELDAQRVGVFGGSYGGFMVLASMYSYNDRIRAGIDVVGISNMVTFLESTQEYRRNLRRVEYGDERIPEMRQHLIEIAPTTNAHKITKPLFVIQGQNDPRVPAGEAEQIVKIVRQNGGQVWYLLGKNEGHGFRKKSNRDYYMNAVMLFWEKFLLDR